MNSSTRPSPELLLPVGTREMLEAAVANGADAVYFGVPHWNARGRTEDFSLEDVGEMIRYARVRGVRTFLAMNVLVFERELRDLPEFLAKVISLEPDAFIIQDIGLARLIRAIAPTQEIHASTQMTLASAESVNLAAKLGFNRAVLARELSLKEIARIKEATPLELEVFIHGALCVSYSGQCLTSENFGGRSANRGQCAQSCRLPYRIFVDGKEFRDTDAQYLFSPHDLCALPRLGELEEIGVNSLKVEGRLKSPEYVAAVARAYRKALDRTPLEASDKEPLEVLFSRGLRTGWLDGDNHQELVDGTFSNHHGMYLGTVVRVERGCVVVELDECLEIPAFAGMTKQDKGCADGLVAGMMPRPGDGILFEEPRFAQSAGARLYASQVVHEHKGKPSTRGCGPQLLKMEFGRDFDTRQVARGMKAYRNDSPALEKELRKTFTDREQAKRIPVKMLLEGCIGTPLSLTVQDYSGHSVTAQGDTPIEEARNSGAGAGKNDAGKCDAGNKLRDLAQKELSALGSTAYRLDNLSVSVAPNAFIAGKMLRTLRQKAIELLDNARCEWKELNPSANAGRALLNSVKFGTKVAPTAARPVISVLVRSPEQIPALEGLDIDNVVMDFDWGVKYDEPLEQIRELGFRAGMATLRIHKPGESHYLKNILRLCPDFALVRNLGALSILKESGIPLAGDYSLNAANCLSYDWLLSQGLQTLHPSWDLNSTQLFDLLGDIDGSRMELTLHQYMPAFHSEYCAFARALTTGRRFPECGKICTQHKVEILDHKGERHFLQSDAECRNTLFVGKPQSALKLLPDLRAAGVNHFRLEMLQEDAATVRKKALIYTQAIRGKVSIDEAIRLAGVEEKYGLSEGQLFNESVWKDRKKN
ncbi:U32 family peptidase [Fibrobacter sp.]|uniref:U32 family peptidase n=1 Tax=Fibrobacter sp. TaxID=35828 RepID=UPI0025BE8E2F|nr:U32 family peptidase [Fibrobacter sp.]MBR4008636.1 U32 family peptidase [Fibrobacter sp.]